jgi:hypothetical protein
MNAAFVPRRYSSHCSVLVADETREIEIEYAPSAAARPYNMH